MTGRGQGWEATRFDELDSIPLFEGIVWHPIRRRLGIHAFGINAYSAESAGKHVIEEHDELGGGAAGHEEVYAVVSGRATFTIGGDTVIAPAGTLVFIADPALKRKAVADEDGTLVLAVGAAPGEVYQVSAWEYYFAAKPAFAAGRYEEAIALMEEGLAERPGHPALLYNLACAESLAGRKDDALAHLGAAVAADPSYAGRARDDADFDPIRNVQGFPA